MDLFVYADESGVLDPAHNEFYVFGGLILVGKTEKDKAVNRYLSVERSIRKRTGISGELKACKLGLAHRGEVFRSLNPWAKFGVIVEQQRLYDSIISQKKTKQRYLDFVFKLGLKRALLGMIGDGVFEKNDVGNIRIFMDEHTTATDGRYELQESLEMEFKHGMHNFETMTHFLPVFPDMDSVQVEMRDSASTPLIRAADMVANRIFYCANSGKYGLIDGKVRYIKQP